jgi:hypothetical protein
MLKHFFSKKRKLQKKKLKKGVKLTFKPNSLKNHNENEGMFLEITKTKTKQIKEKKNEKKKN